MLHLILVKRPRSDTFFKCVYLFEVTDWEVLTAHFEARIGPCVLPTRTGYLPFMQAEAAPVPRNWRQTEEGAQ